jgi:hypothetical protein
MNESAEILEKRRRTKHSDERIMICLGRLPALEVGWPTRSELAIWHFGSRLGTSRRTELDVILGPVWTVVALDVSLSMPMRGYRVEAHQDAVALMEQLQGLGGSDQLRAVIAFSERARSIEIADLASLEFDYMYGSNIAAALHLALAELDGEPGRVVIFSDMEATAYTDDEGVPFFSYPPAPETAEKTIQALDDCLSARVQLEVRRYRPESLEGESGVNALIREVTRRGGHVTEVVLARYLNILPRSDPNITARQRASGPL